MECVSSASASVLVNGSPSKEFGMKRGLRQGDPLSPFLFNMVVEGLHMMLVQALNKGMIEGYKVGSKGTVISHLQFADDTIIFCPDDEKVAVNIKRILRCFELVSGLKINFTKSSLVGVGIPRERTNFLAKSMGCSCGCLPINYLGLPLGANPRSVKTWVRLSKKCSKNCLLGRGGSCHLEGESHFLKHLLPMFQFTIFLCLKPRRQFMTSWTEFKENSCGVVAKREIKLLKFVGRKSRFQRRMGAWV